jgi:regulator of sirC expression with transglutaminase-like and TPR domain
VLKPGDIDEFARHASSDDPDLATPALLISRIEYRRLDPARYIQELDSLGERARQQLASQRDPGPEASVRTLSELLYEEQGFTGNQSYYDDPRNSFLNEVLDRRTGIPITLGVVYLEVARRAGMVMRGINFPGHFLLRFDPPRGPAVVLDPFHGGMVLSEFDCRRLLRHHAGEDAEFDPELLAPADKPQILARMLTNLKRIFVRLRSFPQARATADLLLAIDPDAPHEIRDRGLLAYHLDDYAAALRDLQRYLQVVSGAEADEESRAETEQIWEHVKTLRRRVAGMN